MKLLRSHHLTLRELAGQVLMPAVRLRFLNKNHPDARRLVQLIKRFQPGGIILFGGHPADIHFWVNRLQQESRFPLLVAADLERGVGGLFGAGTTFPHALAWGAAGDSDMVRNAGLTIAREAQLIGINTIFAPVLDLVTNPDNPIINIRGFHHDFHKAAQYGSDFIEAAQAEGVACVAKHFPGHGRSGADSHLDLPVISVPIDKMIEQDLVPFKQAVESGVNGIMTAHIKLKNSKFPATFNKNILNNYLRKEMNFQGVLFSDALNMKAVSGKTGIQEQITLGVDAGLDVFLMPDNLPLFFNTIFKLAEADKKFRKMLEAQVERIFNLKKQIGHTALDSPHLNRVCKFLGHPANAGIANRLAEQSVTCIHKSDNFPLALPSIQKIVHVVHTDFSITNKPLMHLQQEFEQFFDDAVYFINPSVSEIQSSKIWGTDLVVFSLYSRTFAGHRSRFNWSEIARTFRLYADSGNPVIILFFGNPFHLQKFPNWNKSIAVFLLYSYVAPSQRAAFRAVASFIMIRGKLPIQFKDKKLKIKPIEIDAEEFRLIQNQENQLKNSQLDNYINKSIEKQIFPGGVLLIAQRSNIILWKGYGNHDYQDISSPDEINRNVNPHTVYDLASLTKILATTPAILKLIDEGKIYLNQKLSQFFPETKGRKLGNTTISDLLAHQSGLPYWKPFYQDFSDKKSIFQNILRTELIYPPGKKSVYSDLGFILLGEIIEMVTDLDLDTYFRDTLFKPFGLDSLRFIPTSKSFEKDRGDRRLSKTFDLPPTGFDEFRNRIIRNEVNDTNCFIMGGIAGHCGVFGNAKDLAAMGQLFLNNGIYNKNRLVKATTAKLATTRFNPIISNRALGWDTPDENSNSGRYFSETSFGHLAFTGASIWVDPEKDLIVVFLCNCTHPNPDKNKMHLFRPGLHNLIIEILRKKQILPKENA